MGLFEKCIDDEEEEVIDEHRLELSRLAYQVYRYKYAYPEIDLGKYGFSIHRKISKDEVGVVFNDVRVFDLTKDIYVPGEWEESLRLLHLELNRKYPGEIPTIPVKSFVDEHRAKLMDLAYNVYLYVCAYPELDLEEYGFNIYRSGEAKNVVVVFDCIDVLNYDSLTYIPGEWENLLDLVYTMLSKKYPGEIPELSKRVSNNPERALGNIKELIAAAASDEVKIGNKITVRYEAISGEHDIDGVSATHDLGRYYAVYKNRKPVFIAEVGSRWHNDSIKVYSPGPWEDIIPMSIEKVRTKREQSIKEATIIAEIEERRTEMGTQQCLNEVARRYIKKINENM